MLVWVYQKPQLNLIKLWCWCFSRVMLWLLCTLLETISVPCRFRVEKLAFLQSTCLTSNTTESVLDSFGTTCGCYPYILIGAHHRARFAVGALPSESFTKNSVPFTVRTKYTYYSKWKHSNTLLSFCQVSNLPQWMCTCWAICPSVFDSGDLCGHIHAVILKTWMEFWSLYFMVPETCPSRYWDILCIDVQLPCCHLSLVLAHPHVQYICTTVDGILLHHNAGYTSYPTRFSDCIICHIYFGKYSLWKEKVCSACTLRMSCIHVVFEVKVCFLCLQGNQAGSNSWY